MPRLVFQVVTADSGPDRFGTSCGGHTRGTVEAAIFATNDRVQYWLTIPGNDRRTGHFATFEYDSQFSLDDIRGIKLRCRNPQGAGSNDYWHLERLSILEPRNAGWRWDPNWCLLFSDFQWIYYAFGQTGEIPDEGRSIEKSDAKTERVDKEHLDIVDVVSKPIAVTTNTKDFIKNVRGDGINNG